MVHGVWCAACGVRCAACGVRHDVIFHRHGCARCISLAYARTAIYNQYVGSLASSAIDGLARGTLEQMSRDNMRVLLHRYQGADTVVEYSAGADTLADSLYNELRRAG